MLACRTVQTQPALLLTLRQNALNLHTRLSSVPTITLVSQAESPVCHFVPRSFGTTLAGNRAAQLAAVSRITTKVACRPLCSRATPCLTFSPRHRLRCVAVCVVQLVAEGVLASRKRDSVKEGVVAMPTVRLAVTALFTDADVATLVRAVTAAVAAEAGEEDSTEDVAEVKGKSATRRATRSRTPSRRSAK